MAYGRIHSLNIIPIDFSSSGDNQIIAAVAGKRILVHRLFVVGGSATSLIFKRGSTNLSGAMSMSANGGLTFDITGEPWFVTGINEAFNINSSSGVQVGGVCYYDLR